MFMLLKDAAKEFLRSNPKANFLVIRDNAKAGEFIGIHMEADKKIGMITRNNIPKPGDHIQDGTGEMYIVKSVENIDNVITISY